MTPSKFDSASPFLLRANTARATLDAVAAEWIAAGRPRTGELYEAYEAARNTDEIAQSELWA